jgi:hypothetical protein
MEEFIKYNKGDAIVYLGGMPYYLGNGQIVEKEGDELVIRSEVTVHSNLFNFSLENDKKNENQSPDGTPVDTEITPEDDDLEKDEEKPLDAMNKDELIAYADKNNIDVDKRKGAKNILVEIKEAQK